jgi:uncharacterized protein (TIGR02147 family)
LNSKRSIPLKNALRIADILQLKAADREKFLASAIESKPVMKGTKKRDVFKESRYLSEVRFRDILADDEHFVVIALLYSDYEPKTIDGISKKLQMSRTKVELILSRLLKLALVSYKDGVFRNTNKSYHTSDGVSSELIREGHRQVSRVAMQKLSVLKVEQRDFTSVKICGSMASLAEVRKEIRKFQRRLYYIMKKRGQCTEVFELAIQLFPYTDTELKNAK